MTTFAINDCFFLGQYNTFVRTLTKTLYCPKKTNPFLQKCCTVPKKPKNQLFPVFKELPTTGLPQDWFFWNSTALLQKKIGFFGTVQHFCKKMNKNTVLSQKNQSFFAKVLYCPKKTKKPIFSGPGTSQGNKTGKDWFFWFFWNSTAL